MNGDTEERPGGEEEEEEVDHRVALLCRLSRSTSSESRRVREPCQRGISSDVDRLLLLASSVAEYEGGEEWEGEEVGREWGRESIPRC